ncbi:phosphoribosylglycinamide formyltransferase [Vibrio sp. 10N.286.49.B3]|uniref:RelA/SpoT domain-containing protein n=1 Tax=Vibrio sp. 10N.286.49.B3 TaxID=1880855 RepID=UPI000C844533|nr:RelA/SpoT domain-containing protein [Vibrio sp. 10N.286.49.B3]PMH46589.1 phosphoribosylglycinamide formyltransferase [Vibrio sp. 10N.286.49.B3]
MSPFLRTAALMFLVLSRAPAFAAAAPLPSSIEQNSRSTVQNETSSRRFRHSLSGLYGIKSLSTDPIQPYSDFDELYSHSHQAQSELEALCINTALLTGSTTSFAGIKSQQRALEKINLKFNGQVNRITDIARATIVSNDVESLVDVYEKLSQEAEIVQVKNRFKSPKASGYRDLNLLVKLPKSEIVAEVQLHLEAIAHVKNGKEHGWYEDIQAIERQAYSQQRSLNELESAKIAMIRSQSAQLYQEAWQPYITTHIQAA